MVIKQIFTPAPFYERRGRRKDEINPRKVHCVRRWKYLCTSWIFISPWQIPARRSPYGLLLKTSEEFGIKLKTLEESWRTFYSTLTLPMLRLLLSKAQGCKYFWKTCKQCHVGIHWIALAEYFQMSTHMQGFQSFSGFLASFCIGQISHQLHKC